MTVLGVASPFPATCPVYFATTDGSGDSKDADTNAKQEEPPQETEQPASRIPTFDQFERYKDSSRPPDSHYTSDLSGPRRAGTASITVKNNFHIVGFLLGVHALLKFGS
ncbi:unnamed protein product [Chrysodeixis includens]|uniref:Uncharacterized protein n=1 Tax=Chrysodeixis includens TaxID=689277 RepID=A0A9N8PX97_CHRIL|nr:unnamed protein product [Chrysodeixis includens]